MDIGSNMSPHKLNQIHLKSVVDGLIMNLMMHIDELFKRFCHRNRMNQFTPKLPFLVKEAIIVAHSQR
jgi:hypothetical protein